MKYCRTTCKISPSYLNCDSSSFLLNISGVNDALVTFFINIQGTRSLLIKWCRTPVVFSTTFSFHFAYNLAFQLNEMCPDRYPETRWSCCHGQIYERNSWTKDLSSKTVNGQNQSCMIICVLSDGEKTFKCCGMIIALMIKVQPYNHFSPQYICGDLMSWNQAIQMVIFSLYLNNFSCPCLSLDWWIGLKSLHPCCV